MKRADGQVGKPENWVGPEAELEQICFEAGLIDKVEGDSNVA